LADLAIGRVRAWRILFANGAVLAQEASWTSRGLLGWPPAIAAWAIALSSWLPALFAGGTMV
jgi:hypothetical protein